MSEQINEIVETGATVEEAVQRACEALGADREQVTVEVLEEPAKKSGLLGLFSSTPAKVKVTAKQSSVQKAIAYLSAILPKLGVKELDFKTTMQDNTCIIEIFGDDLGVVIGRHGDTIDALQYLTSLVAKSDDDVRIKLDAAGYRAKREQALTALATRVANKAVKTRRSKTLEPMNPYERRIIHTAVQEVEGAKSWSVGEEPNRCVVIGSENGRPPREGEEKPRSRGSNRGRRDDRRREPRDDSKYAHRNDLYTKKPRPVVPFKERTQSNIELKAADTPLYSRLDKDDDFDY